MSTEVHCAVCHRRERWLPSGETDVSMEGGTRRPPGSIVRAAFDRIAAASAEGEAVLSTCVCGMPLVGPPELETAPQAAPFHLALPQGELVARGRTVTLDGEPAELGALTPAVHEAFPADDVDDATFFERLFTGSLLTAMMVPVGLWCIAVFVVLVFYKQWATYGVPVGR